MTSQSLNEFTAGSMPYVDLKILQVLHILVLRRHLQGTKENMQLTVWLELLGTTEDVMQAATRSMDDR